jgi:uncharacterized protein YjbJ (UPF0337 family)
MNWNRIEGNWKQAKGKVREEWGKLTDDQLDVIGGRREKLVGQIQETYGIAQDEAERRVVDWESTRGRDLFDDAEGPRTFEQPRSSTARAQR